MQDERHQRRFEARQSSAPASPAQSLKSPSRKGSLVPRKSFNQLKTQQKDSCRPLPAGCCRKSDGTSRSGPDRNWQSTLLNCGTGSTRRAWHPASRHQVLHQAAAGACNCSTHTLNAIASSAASHSSYTLSTEQFQTLRLNLPAFRAPCIAQTHFISVILQMACNTGTACVGSATTAAVHRRRSLPATAAAAGGPGPAAAASATPRRAADVAVIGSSLQAYAAAYMLARAGRRTVLVEYAVPQLAASSSSPRLADIILHLPAATPHLVK